MAYTKRQQLAALARAQVVLHIQARAEMQECLGSVDTAQIVRHHGQANQCVSDAGVLADVAELIELGVYNIIED
jgi:hypothetical protein